MRNLMQEIRPWYARCSLYSIIYHYLAASAQVVAAATLCGRGVLLAAASAFCEMQRMLTTNEQTINQTLQQTRRQLLSYYSIFA